MSKNIYWINLFIVWILASIATTGSLFFSEVMGFIPCSLCWYQRIFMYSLSFIFLVAVISPDKNIIKYGLTLAIPGWAFALYHNLLHYKIIPESASPCQQGVPCSQVWIKWWGFLTIPMLSFIAFSLIIFICLQNS